MPTVNVVERSATPNIRLGIVTGLITAVILYLWYLLAQAGSPKPFLSEAALISGNDAFHGNQTTYWLVGTIGHFLGWLLTGVVFAVTWPHIRKRGMFLPTLLFFMAGYVVIQIFGRLYASEFPDNFPDVVFFFAAIIAAIVFTYRFRRE